jgi:outer membrane autotransporter barrel domain
MTITPATAAVLSMATVDPLIFRAELDTVRGRLDQTRSYAHDTSVWVQYSFSNFEVSSPAGAGYDMNTRGLTLGTDKSIELDNGIATLGAFTSYSRSDPEFYRNGNGEVDSYSIGAYASYLHRSGFYADGVLKANHFSNDTDARMSSGGKASGGYSTNGVGLHLQGGKYFYFDNAYIAPYVALSTFTSDSSEYSLSNGMKARVDTQRSVTGETGIRMGHKFEIKGVQAEPYFRMAVAREFVDNNEVKVNDDRFINDLSGSRSVYAVGVSARLTDRLAVQVDASHSDGKQVDEPWTMNLGVSWKF